MVVILVLLTGPPYGVLGVLIHYNVLVLRRTSGIDTGHDVDSTKFGYLTFFVALKARLGLFVEKNFVRRVVEYLG